LTSQPVQKGWRNILQEPPLCNIVFPCLLGKNQKIGSADSDTEVFLFIHRFTPSPGQSRLHSSSDYGQLLISGKMSC
ncbi:MAG: hypothetical protein WCK54_21575, partial [Desulfuromonadales bacterium]